MKNLKSVELIPKAIGEVVIFRADMDVPTKNGEITDDKRLKNSVKDISMLIKKGYRIVIIGHRGRPIGYEEKFSLKPIAARFLEIIKTELGNEEITNTFIEDITNETEVKHAINLHQVIFTENIRFYQEEQAGSIVHFSLLMKYSSVFIFDAITVAHRSDGSVVLQKEMEEIYYGSNFMREYKAIEKLNQIDLIIIAGAKDDKTKYLSQLANRSGTIFIGGKLPLSRTKIESSQTPTNVVWATLTEDSYDLSSQSIIDLKILIQNSKTIVWTGALGWFEKGYNKGTVEIATALIESNSYIVIGGGDTGASIIGLGGKDRIDFLCSGGGALLYALAFGPENLPAVS